MLMNGIDMAPSAVGEIQALLQCCWVFTLINRAAVRCLRGNFTLLMLMPTNVGIVQVNLISVDRHIIYAPVRFMFRMCFRATQLKDCE